MKRTFIFEVEKKMDYDLYLPFPPTALIALLLLYISDSQIIFCVKISHEDPDSIRSIIHLILRLGFLKDIINFPWCVVCAGRRLTHPYHVLV
jgi:hypothetical protein